MKLKNNLNLTENERKELIKYGQDIDNKNHVFNIYHSLALTILYEMGLVGHDGTIRYELVKDLSIFLENKNIDTITKVIENKNKIKDFVCYNLNLYIL